jgi:hypothetical protein
MLSNYEIDRLADALIKRMPKNDEVLTTKQVSEILGITVQAVQKRCSRGQLPYHKKSGTLYFSKNELTEFLLK